jgi:hypothetical protein
VRRREGDGVTGGSVRLPVCLPIRQCCPSAHDLAFFCQWFVAIGSREVVEDDLGFRNIQADSI